MQLAAYERSARRSPCADKIDTRILRVLQRDGRISSLKLAEEVHLSPTAVIERVKRLQRDGFILGYCARLNPTKLGMRVYAFVEVQLDATTPEVMKTFTEAVQQRTEILECHLIAGGFDYLLKVLVSQGDAWRDEVKQLVAGLPGVRDTRSYTVMEQVKHGQRVVL